MSAKMKQKYLIKIILNPVIDFYKQIVEIQQLILFKKDFNQKLYNMCKMYIHFECFFFKLNKTR